MELGQNDAASVATLLHPLLAEAQARKAQEWVNLDWSIDFRAE
jgi:hypothetical protein